MLASFLFLNPFTMIVGGALIASPIIIHLINRMRFKRVRWAAMEFLLKAQKRSRRKMIIEQMILLLLRVLLVLLIALLLSRLIEKKEEKPPDVPLQYKEPPTPTRHVVILDDTASMNDRWRDERGQEILAIDNARKMVLEYIVDIVKDAPDPHEFVFINLSQPEKPRDFELLQAASRAQIEDHVRNRTPVQLYHYDLLPALKKAQSIFDEAKNMNLVLHIVSDFRAVDWNDSTKDALGGYFQYFEQAKVQVKLHDVAAPLRDAGDKPVASSGNLAIVDFRPESRLVVKDFPVEFTVTVANHGNSDMPNVFVRVRVNNDLKQDASVNIPLIRANDSVTARMVFALNRTAGKDEAHKFDGFNLVSASIENEKEGLSIDNTRYAFVEVRDKLPLLLVDNNIANRFTKNSESFYLWKLYGDTYKGFDVQIKTAADLDNLNLVNYSAVIFCDIPAMSPKAVQKVESYVNGGGGVGFFMGQSIRDPKFYNENLWKEGKGIFPVPLLEFANKQATTEQLDQILRDQSSSWNRKLLVRKDTRRHPAMEKLYSDSRGQTFNDETYEKLFNIVDFARYYVIDRPKYRPADNVQTLLYLPNNKPIADYEKRTKELLRKLREATDETARRAMLQQKFEEATDDGRKRAIKEQIDGLKVEMEKYAEFQKTLKEYSDAVNNTVGKYDNPLHLLALWMDVLLEDTGDKERKIASMVQFWQMPELADLKQEFLQFNDVIKYGDPFYIAKQQGKGRVLAYLGSAGASGPEGDYWSPLNRRGRVFFPPLMKDSLQRYLCSTGGDFFLPLSKPFEFDLDPAAYEKDVHVWSVQEIEKPTAEENKIKTTDMHLRNIPGSETEMVYKFAEGTDPGMYLFEFYPRAPDGSPKKESDLRALAYNFDTRIESNLVRARSDDLKAIARVEKIETLDVKNLPQKISRESLINFPPKESDLGLSKAPWLYLGMLLALILEQAWAVRLSFHVRPSSGPLVPQHVGRATVTA